MHTRAERRHFRHIAVARALRVLRHYDRYTPVNKLDARGLHPLRDPFEPEKTADNMKRHSHPGCCTQMRKIHGPRIQELRQIDATPDDTEEDL